MTEKQLYTRVRIIAVSAVLGVLLLLICIIIQSVTLSKINAANNIVQQQVEVLDRQTKVLEEEIEYRNSRAYIEQYAREKLGLGYGNETKYIINQE